MRTAFALVLAIALGACGSTGPGGGDDDDTTTPPDGDVPAVPPDIKLVSPDISIDPGQEVTYCWYFRTPNTKPLAIKHWASTMTPGSHHLILFTTQTDAMPEGTVSTVNCGSGGVVPAVWTYSAQTPTADLQLPANDGAGKPVAMEIAAHTPGFIQMHYNNRTDSVIKAHVEVTANALGEGVAYTRTAAFVTYNASINIPAGAVGDVESMTCSVPATSKFWMMSTHAHKQAVHTAVKNGGTNGAIVFQSDDWEHPGAARWDTAPFFSFSNGKLTYECTYNNTTNSTIITGDSAQTDEMCMASGYFFPATRPVFCYNNVVL